MAITNGLTWMSAARGECVPSVVHWKLAPLPFFRHLVDRQARPPQRSDLFHVVFLLCLRGGELKEKLQKKLCISAIENSRIGLSLRASLESYPPCIQ